MIKRFEEFTKNVAIASKCISKIKAYEMKKFGLRSGNLMCLFFLGQNPDGITPSILSSKCGEDKAGISRSLAKLCEKGYVVVDKSEHKYRAKFKITESGKAICEELNGIITSVVDSIGKDLTVTERATFYYTFDYITSNLQNFCMGIEDENEDE